MANTKRLTEKVEVLSHGTERDGGYGGYVPTVTVEDISDWPTSFPPEIGITAITAAAGNHDHAEVEDTERGLVAAATIQALAVALSARIVVLETAAPEEGG